MATVSDNKPHVLAVPLPAQGHVKPLMSLCRQIAKHGIKVTFVNAQSIHHKILSESAAEEEDDDSDANIVMTTVPDGLTPTDDPNSPFTLFQTLPKTMPQTLPELIERINGENPNQKISCVIADLSFGWISEIAEKKGAEFVGFSPPSFASLAVLLQIPNLIQQGYLDTNGSLEKIDLVSLSDDIPSWRKDEFPWSISSDLKIQKIIFDTVQSYKAADKAKWLLSNTCYELEPAACDLYPGFLPIGPLHLVEEAKTMEKSRYDFGNFYSEDATCLIWLDTKPPGSVVYVSFGSLSFYSQQQLHELALGLELSRRDFLWVVRRDLANGLQAILPDGFLERVVGFGKIVEWAPQDEVLSHPAIACFVSHCGWNSTLEGVSKGVPYLCWPYFADQFHNESYICDKWEIGLRIDCDENRIRSRYEIMKKIDMLLCESRFKENALKLKETCAKSIGERRSSYINLMTFIDHLRKCTIS
ncbi:UDP-glycosyltransferase 83A1-like [Salvia miltiorrhiza]|uniref:UDP-glycosyltransferase 83A1-like n=1 Tax=Salvia miltiorrhiza TaxID=226208 RepID=UPI0025AD5D3F|nr:UDP-glycosyltransferase 83A1-like [Salvia miltiorrhiza]